MRPTFRVSTLALLALSILAGFIPCSQADEQRKATPMSPTFPLRVSENHRYLVDAQGRPFLINGDSPWEIAWQLTTEEAVELLDNRQAKGFNAILVDVLPYSEWSPYLTEKNRYGHGPFLTPGDFATPDDAYFAHLDWLIRTAGEKGMLLMLVAADIGSAGDRPTAGAKNGMWREQYLANGVEKCYRYGRYLGHRYKSFPNVLWVLGGDRDPGDLIEHVKAMARGLEETAPDQLKTYHAGAKNGSIFFGDAPWCDINMSYGYTEPYGFVLDDYRKQPVKPCFMGESGYEGEANDQRPGTPLRVRRQVYWALLAGACGHLYGSAAWTVQPDVWRKWLDSPGAQHLAHFNRFFQSLDWFRLVPDADHAVLTGGLGEAGSAEYATCAWIPGGSLALCYLPTERTVTVDLRKLKGPVQARWFDPTRGTYVAIDGSPFAGSGLQEFTPPAHNAAGDSDMVLVLQSAESAVSDTAELAVEHRVIDAAPPRDPHIKAAGDISGDGHPDLVVASSAGGPLVWYRYPDWRRHEIAPSGRWSCDARVVDMDGDGDGDLLISEWYTHNRLEWYENPLPSGDPAKDPWTHHVIGAPHAHDVRVGDLDGDGQMEFVTRSQNEEGHELVIWKRRGGEWTSRHLPCPAGEGLALGDLLRRGRVDIVIGGRWYEAPPDVLAGEWREHVYAEWPPDAVVQVADMNGDGRPDIVLTRSEGHHHLSWFEAPAEVRTDPWQEHVVDDSVDYAHSLAVCDLNGDGQLDIVTAEMHQSPRRRVLVYLGKRGGTEWQRHVLADTGSHNLCVARLGGRFGIVGANWSGDHQPLELWEL